MFRQPPADKPGVAPHTLTWRCPRCGSPVRLSETSSPPFEKLDEERFNRLAHAVCGCYILDMPSGALSRLLASVLIAECPEAQDSAVNVGAPDPRQDAG